MLLAITACSPSVARVDNASNLAQRLSDALARRDPSAFAQAFPDSAPSRAQAQRWYQLLIHSGAAITPDGTDRLSVSTTLPGDRRAATERLTLTWAGDGFGVAAHEGTPLWALEPAVASTDAGGTVLTAAGADAAETWLAVMARAESAVRAAGVVPSGTWSGRLVIELPTSAADFALLTGSTADTSSAVTSCRSGTPRIVLSPTLADYPDSVRFATLTHEAVHAATDSACLEGLSWAVEGLAESVAAAADPATASSNAAIVSDYLAARGLPSALPEHPSTPTDYALAQVAADELRRRLGTRATEYFARATRGALTTSEVAQATSWYRQALRSLAG